MITFESYDRREKQILSKLAEYGIGSIEEAEQIRLTDKMPGYPKEGYIREEAEYMLKKTVEKYAGRASEFAEWLESEIPEGLTVFNLAPDSVGVRRKLRTTK